MKNLTHTIVLTLVLTVFASSTNHAFAFTPTRHGIESEQVNLSMNNKSESPVADNIQEIVSRKTNNSSTGFTPNRHGVGDAQTSTSMNSPRRLTGFMPTRHGL